MIKLQITEADELELSQAGPFGVHADVKLLNRSCFKLWTGSNDFWKHTFKLKECMRGLNSSLAFA